MFMMLFNGAAITKFHSVHLLNVEQCQVAANLWTKPVSLDHETAYRLSLVYYCCSVQKLMLVLLFHAW